ncbi:type II secretion system F family protein [Halobacillus campisalis]|uniref:Type II secretion system F family protein n=1 Tax=Halobacillus campisalis TaxID=435909 RepID=A0ABW2K3Z3_9BACI|nr:type II secretion system F family protein [Halobacillus campisalis]
MAHFKYDGRNKQGRKKSGKIRAESKQEALQSLRESGMFIAHIEEMNGFLYQEIRLAKKVKSQDFVLYLRQFETLIAAGVSILDSTYILMEQSNSKSLKKVLRDVAEELEAGHAYSDAADRHQDVFPVLFINMVRAGEAGGNLDEVLQRMASYYEKQHDLKQKVISALSYPFVVGLIALSIVVFMLSYVVPRFEDMFLSFGSDIPPFTHFVLNIGTFFGVYWWLMLTVPVLLVFGYQAGQRHPAFAYYTDYYKMRIPLFGKLIQKAALSKMTRTLSSLFNSSVPILQSIYITEKIVGNKVIEQALRKSADSMEKGESMAEPFRDHWAIPNLVTQMIIIGEKTGALDQMLSKVADFYEREIDHTTDRIKTLIEPIMIVVLAVMVGGIVTAVAVPMFSIFEQI